MMTKLRYRSEALEAAHDLASGLHRAGAISDERMREYDLGCLEDVVPVKPEQLKQLRTAHDLTQADFADQLNVSPQLVSRWERGLSTPRGAALKLLLLVRDKGIDAIS